MKWRRKNGVTEWFVSSAVLAAVLIVLRYALRGKLSPKLQYGLWLTENICLKKTTL